MFYKVLAASTILLASVGFAQLSSAEQLLAENAANATIVVYRADESIRTERLSMDLHVGEASMGRLKPNGSVVVSQPAGEYTIGSSIRGTESMVVELKPGQTYYLHTEMEMRGTRVMVSFAEVEEQVARVQQPELDSAI